MGQSNAFTRFCIVALTCFATVSTQSLNKIGEIPEVKIVRATDRNDKTQVTKYFTKEELQNWIQNQGNYSILELKKSYRDIFIHCSSYEPVQWFFEGYTVSHNCSIHEFPHLFLAYSLFVIFYCLYHKISFRAGTLTT
jgi:hypothetical protein